MSNIIDFFPKNYNPLPQQQELLSAIDKAFKSGKKLATQF